MSSPEIELLMTLEIAKYHATPDGVTRIEQAITLTKQLQESEHEARLLAASRLRKIRNQRSMLRGMQKKWDAIARYRRAKAEGPGASAADALANGEGER